MKMGNRLVMIFVFAVVASLLLLSGCKGKTENVDLTTPPPLPDESGAEGEEQPPAPPASDQQSGQGQQLPELPLLG